jgi:hypothetical protein
MFKTFVPLLSGHTLYEPKHCKAVAIQTGMGQIFFSSFQQQCPY